MTFQGFSTDGLVALPPELFTEVLPAITLASELKVTLHIFYRLRHQRGNPRRISWDELAHDQTLLQGLRMVAKLRPPLELLDEGLEAAVRRTTLLHVALPGEGRLRNWYLVHTASNREWVQAARLTQPNSQLSEPEAVPTVTEGPSLLTLYEQNIGLVTPLVVEELREAEELYPAEWIADAIRESVRSNIRSWRYIRKILESWARNGRNNATHHAERPIDIEKYLRGPHGHLFQRGGRRSDEQNSWD